MILLKEGDTVGLIACSDGLQDKAVLDLTVEALHKLGLQTYVAKTILQRTGTFSGSPQERAYELHALFANPTIKAIFDISGGDTANQILPYLDFPLIRQNPKILCGLSDLSTILNAIYTHTRLVTYHYRAYNLYRHPKQTELFKTWFFQGNFFTFDYEWWRGTQMNGTIIGGNINCFLKLAGTPYLPNPKGKLLFLESLSGSPNRIASYFAQLDQIGYLRECAGLILGTFTEMESQNHQPNLATLVVEATQLPIIKTTQLGHGTDSHCLPLGLPVQFEMW